MATWSFRAGLDRPRTGEIGLAGGRCHGMGPAWDASQSLSERGAAMQVSEFDVPIMGRVAAAQRGEVLR
jgi:hypothetical protein